MTLSSETKANERRKADGRRSWLRCISLIALIGAIVGVALLIARWTGPRGPVGRSPTAARFYANRRIVENDQG